MFSFFKRRKREIESFQRQHDLLQECVITSVVMHPEFFAAGQRLMQAQWQEQILCDIEELRGHEDIRVRRIVQEVEALRNFEKG